MSSEGLHEAFALLLREHEGHVVALSASAALAIRRRVVARWMGGLGALVVVAGLAATTLSGTGGADDNRAVVDSPTPSPTIGFAHATFPLTGGPEFVAASAGLGCGDPAPAPHATDHDLILAVSPGSVFTLGEGGINPWPPVVQASIRQTTTASRGKIATSGVDFLLVKGGIVRGIITGSGVSLSQNVAGGTVSIPQDLLVVGGVYCPEGAQPNPSAIEEGTYEVIAIGRFFSTAESVALSQVLGDTINTMYLNPNTVADPNALYLPGIYGCDTARAWDSALRGCLPEISDTAVVDEAAGTVTVRYRTRDLVEEFSVVLVSEPLTIDLAIEAAE